ncbi:MAG: hypothetical protein HYR67_00455 [Bacteroidetes bacterium]|nr:hypothetical protein [Bacteroidota bacterium]
MRKIIQMGLTLLCVNLIAQTLVFGQTEVDRKSPLPKCSSEDKPYRDFDFLIGRWDFLTEDGTKVGEHVYTKREQGCLIVEEWTDVSGGTGLGMSFVDPSTGLWRQVWMSPMFHIDYSGRLNESGAMILEGTIYPNNGGESSPVRGVWTKQADGSVKQEFITLNKKTNIWETFFVGFSHRKQG